MLVAPRHHALQNDWVRAMRALPTDLKREIGELSFLYRFTQLSCLLPDAGGGDDDFATELARLRALPPEIAGPELLRPIYDHGGTRAWADLVADPGVRRRAPARLLENPDQLLQRFADLVQAYWDAAFAAEWSRIEPLLATAVLDAGRRIAADGVYPFLLGLRPPLAVDPANTSFGLDLPHEHRVSVDAQSPLVLVPSVFVWPHVHVNCDGPWPLALVFRAPHLVERRRAAPAESVAPLRALADPTRLRIVELVAERPRTTRELASLVSLSEAGTSKHLRILAAAGLLQTRREGYYVVYSLTREAFHALADDVRRLATPPTALT